MFFRLKIQFVVFSLVFSSLLSSRLIFAVHVFSRVFLSADISGGFLKSAKKSGGKIQLRIMEDSELDALESLLKHTHGCDYYNFEGCEL